MSLCRSLSAVPFLAAVACSVGGPAIEPVDDQIVAVGDELLVEIRAASPDGDAVRYRFSSNVPDLGDGAVMTERPDGSGLFRWRPTAKHIGRWVFDFQAADGSGETTESVAVEVRSAMGANTIPLFRRPVGAGTAVDLTRTECVELEVEMTDQDSTRLVIAEEEPRIDGAELFQETDMSAIWRWCPTEAQRQAQDRYLLTLSADDGENPKAIKRYQIILRGQPKESCAGGAPRIEHAPEDRVTVTELEVRADVLDESGLKAAPLLYYSLVEPTDPPDLRAMTQLNMTLALGDVRAGTWTATLPNPLADAPPGTEQTIWYVLVAEDNDDLLGDCDHLATQVFQMTVSTPGGDGDQALCTPCTADNQCGGTDDHCLRVGVEGHSFCMQGCAADSDCPEGTVCSSGELESIEGARGRQCVPLDEQCEATADRCANDDLEGNDSRAAAQPLAPGARPDLMLCPVVGFGSEDDWFRIDVTSDSSVEIALDGAAEPDMDLDLLDESGLLIGLTWDSGSQDRLSMCLPAGTYYVRAFSFWSGENPYTVSWSATPDTCDDAWWTTCWDDSHEEDDGTATARWIELGDPVHQSAGNQICSGDEDWYEVYMFSGETLHATMRFDASTPGKDLDFLIHDASGAPITRCSEEEPWECTSNGQSGGSNESITWQPPATGRYYLVVRGWAGAENSYDLCASLDPANCPRP